MRKTIGLLIVSTLIIVIIIFVFSRKDSQKKDGKLAVVTSIYPLLEFTKRSGGKFVNVKNITSGKIEPHDFEPTPQDLVKINQADLFIFNGAGLDPWAKRLEPELISKGVLVIDMSKHFKIKRIAENKDSRKVMLDPHIWLDPILAKAQVSIIKDALIKIDGRHKAIYRIKSKRYMTKLDVLNNKFKRNLKKLRIKEFVVSHAAFGYLAKRYNIKMIPIAISPNEEPSSKRISRLVNIIRRKKIKYIFFETLTSGKTTKTIAEEAHVKTLLLNPIEGLTPKEIKKGENYLTIMRKNLLNLRLAMK